MTSEMWQLVFLAVALNGLFAVIGGLIGQGRGKAVDGIIWGALLGLLGLVLFLVLNPKNRKCPACLGSVPKEAVKCRHCGSDLGTAPVPPL